MANSVRFVKFLALAIIFFLIASYIARISYRNRLLLQIIERLTAESRIAEVIVTKSEIDRYSGKTFTTIKFVEYDTKLNPLPAQYFTFSNNIIQFQSMVIRFDDFYVKRGHPLKGKSAYIFMKVFSLADKGSEVFDINAINEIPSGYKVQAGRSNFERRLWEKFWRYALDPKEAKKIGIKNAQIEAPGTKFIPGMFYTIKIEHDGGIRIDAKPLPSPVTKGGQDADK